MARDRSRSRGYSPRLRSRSPLRERKRYVDDRDRDRDRRSPDPSGLLIRNLPLDTRPDDLRIPFERFGPVKDIYLPKNYYTGEPRGFGFVKFRYAEDAAEAKQRMNHKVIGGREISIVFAEENRKTPHEMRMNNRISGRYGGHKRTSPRLPRRRYRSYSRSPSPARRDSRQIRDDDSPSPQRLASISRSPLPCSERNYRSSRMSGSPRRNGKRPRQEGDYTAGRSRSPMGQ